MSTRIEWTDETWNPMVGCSHVSPGCANCYAARQASRGLSRAWAGTSEWGRWTDRINLLPERLDQPLKWRKPRRVFVCSMGDLFHEGVPEIMIAAVWAAMAMAGEHTFQVLTKRPARMAELLNRPDWPQMVSEAKAVIPHDAAQLAHFFTAGRKPRDGFMPLPNVWLGVTAEDQQRADERIPLLLQCPAAVRFVSVEPMLGAVDLTDCAPQSVHHGNYLKGTVFYPIPNYWKKLDWVICGGETGPGARPMHPDWARSLRDQCVEAGVPFFFKRDSSGCRTLDGQAWEQYPKVSL